MEILKRCFREPISEVYKASEYLSQALKSHLAGDSDLAAELITHLTQNLIKNHRHAALGVDNLLSSAWAAF